MEEIDILELYANTDNKYAGSIEIEIKEAIKNLINRNKELEEKNKELETAYLLQKDLFNDFEKGYVSKEKIIDKREQDIKTNEHTILGGRRNGKTLEYGIRLGRIQMCEELLGDDK